MRVIATTRNAFAALSAAQICCALAVLATCRAVPTAPPRAQQAEGSPAEGRTQRAGADTDLCPKWAEHGLLDPGPAAGCYDVGGADGAPLGTLDFSFDRILTNEVDRFSCFNDDRVEVACPEFTVAAVFAARGTFIDTHPHDVARGFQAWWQQLPDGRVMFDVPDGDYGCVRPAESGFAGSLQLERGRASIELQRRDCDPQALRAMDVIPGHASNADPPGGAASRSCFFTQRRSSSSLAGCYSFQISDGDGEPARTGTFRLTDGPRWAIEALDPHEGVVCVDRAGANGGRRVPCPLVTQRGLFAGEAARLLPPPDGVLHWPRGDATWRETEDGFLGVEVFPDDGEGVRLCVKPSGDGFIGVAQYVPSEMIDDFAAPWVTREIRLARVECTTEPFPSAPLSMKPATGKNE